MMPSLQHVSVGVCSDNFDDKDGSDEINSENGNNTDFDIREDDLSEDDEEEEFSGDEEEEDDDSQIEDLIDDLEVKFRKLVYSKIEEAEEFFDDADTLQRACALHFANGEEIDGGVTRVTVDNNNGSPTGDRVSVQLERVLGTSSDNSEGQRVPCTDMGTQTEDDFFVTKSSGTLVSNENMANKVESLEPEQARVEIGALRDMRDFLVAQRRKWDQERKQTEEGNEEASKRAECVMYKFEEAIEALDKTIEFKNEIILGQQPRKSEMRNEDDPVEASLSKSLDSLSAEELRRLVSGFYSKIAEIRYSSRRLEKREEYLEGLYEQTCRKLAKEHKHSREMEEEYQSRIRLILTTNNPNSTYMWYRQMNDQLAASRKKQHDLERSLTALLVRHGYLVDGADYDVKQVVKMLGIENQFAGKTSRTRGDSGSTAAHHSRATATPGGYKTTKERNLSSRRNGRVLNGHELMRVPKDSRERAIDGWEREREQKHDNRHVLGQQLTAEVRRERRRLIIQPNSGAPSSSHYDQGTSGRSHHHHGHHQSHNHGYKHT